MEGVERSFRRKLAFLFMGFFVVVAPLHAFLITWLRHFALPEIFLLIFAALRELLVVAVFFLSLPEIIKTVASKRAASFIRDNIFAVLFLALGSAFLLFQENFSQWLWGARFTLLPFIVLLIFQLAPIGKSATSRLVAIILGTGMAVALFGLAHATIFPQDFMTRFGYSVNRDIWDIKAPIASCQYLEHTKEFCRATSTFGGPSRYGTYLLLVFGLALSQLFSVEKMQHWQRAFLILLSLLLVANIALTFSRSIWIGLAAQLAAAALLQFSSAAKLLKIALPGALLFGLILIVNIDSLGVIFKRAASTSEHLALMKNGFETMTEHPLGLGLGTAGAASVRFEKLITENWFLQIGVEMGILGLALFCAALFSLFRRLFENRKNFVAAGTLTSLVGISVAGLFTHSFEETTTVVILFGLAGLSLRKSSLKSPQEACAPNS